MTKDFDDMLRMDPLLEAEKITGLSYKEDKETADLGMALHILHNTRKRDELSLRDDTYYSMEFADALRIVQETGFVPIFDHLFQGRDGTERFLLLWRDGVLVDMESYTYGGRVTLNTLHMVGNWLPNEGIERWNYTSSGHFKRDGEGWDDYPEGDPRNETDPWVWIGHWDGREAFRNTMEKLDANGTWVPVWKEIPFTFLISYTEKVPSKLKKNWDKESNWYHARTREKLEAASVPAEIRDMILPLLEDKDEKRKGRR